MKGLFSSIHFKDLWYSSWRKNSQKWGTPYNFIALEFLTLRLIHPEPLGILPLQVRFLYPSTVPTEVFGLGKEVLLHSPVFLSSVGSSLPYDLTSLIDLTEVVFVYSAFYMLDWLL